MTQNTRFVLKAICDASRPFDDVPMSEHVVNSLLQTWQLDMEKTEDIIITLYSDVIDAAANKINMRLRPEHLFRRITTVLRKTGDADTLHAAEKLQWYSVVCGIITHLFSQQHTPIVYHPFDI